MHRIGAKGFSVDPTRRSLQNAGYRLRRIHLPRLSGKCSVSGMVTYAWRHGEQEIPHGPVRRRMALHRPSPARAHRTRTPQAARPEGDPGRRLLRAQERLPLAVVAEGLRTPWKTVYDWFRGWRIDGTWQRLNAELRGRLRRRLGTPARHAGSAGTRIPARASWTPSQ
jgi:transposase